MGKNARYGVFGLTIDSEIALPELPEDPGSAMADVVIRRGRFVASPGEPFGLTVLGNVSILNIEDVGRFRMTAGTEIVVEEAPGGSPLNLRLYLLGSAFAAILHQRGLLPIHANAVVVGGRAIGFMGHPGAGKSTLAAWFHDRGFDVLADDVCVIRPSPEGSPVAYPGIPRLRLWREALEASGRTAEAYERSFEDLDKYTVPTLGERVQQPVPLSHFYVLEKAVNEAAEVRRLEGMAAVEALVANTYRGAYIPMMGRTGEHLLACAELARLVPVFAARRRWGLDEMDEEAGALEAHARNIIEGQ